MNYFSPDNYATIMLCIGLALIFMELFVSVAMPMLFGIGCLITSALIYFGMIATIPGILVSVALLSSVSALLLWKPLKRFQNAEVPTDTSSDMFGRILLVTKEVTAAAGAVAHSGVDFPCRADASESETIQVGEKVKVVGINGSMLLVVRA